jgi:UDP:flavonoid glycosyltransferase YjiC (YdhE family)
MMRILFTTTAGIGHFHPLVPPAQAAVRAGHEVAFACPHSLCPYVLASGFEAFPVIDLNSLAAELMGGRGADVPEGATAAGMKVAHVFVDTYARGALPELVALCQRWLPDVIVREELEFAGAIAAEHLGLPHASIQVQYGRDWMRVPGIGPAISQRLEKLCTDWRLPADPELAMLSRYLVLSFDPPSLRDPQAVLPETTHHLRAEAFDRSGTEMLPDWLTEDAPRPLIYVTLGSEAAGVSGLFPNVYQTLLAGLREVVGTVALTIGRHRDPAALGPQPAHIHVERYIPQSLLLPHCDVVVTHGGHNTVLAALSVGVPLVLVPLFADQFDNAARCAALEVGKRIVGSDLSPSLVRDTVRAVLDDGRYRRNARRLQAEMRALPGSDHGVRLLEQLVAEHKPVFAGA